MPATLLTLLSKVAPSRPHHPAILEGTAVTSYASLWQRVGDFAAQMGTDLPRGAHLAAVLDAGADAAQAVYGTWAAGGVYVGLNTSLKPDDLVWQIRHSEARVLVIGARYAALLPLVADMDLVVWQLHEGVLTRCQANRPAPAATTAAIGDTGAWPSPDAPAAIIYTSGTTGAPKGVMLSHGNLAANAAGIRAALPMRADDVALCPLPFFYAYGFSVLHAHLSLGATLVIETSLMYPLKVLERLHDVGATAFYGVPSTYYLLLERGHLAHAAEQGWTRRLRYCAQAGGAMDPARIDQLQAVLPGAEFYVMYGQTEASSRLTTLPARDLQTRRGSVGLPLAGVTLSIRHADDGHVLPVGEVGEVCAQGPNVMQGYWQSPEDTAATLRDGWLWTGDVGHLDADGYLYLSGRSRELIKTGAHRVSPWEIEQVIQSVPGVQEAAVRPVPDALLGEVVQACVLLAADAGEPEEMRRRILQTCKARLASYKMPRYVLFVDDMPRTASGKVQKHKLPLHPSCAVIAQP